MESSSVSPKSREETFWGLYARSSNQPVSQSPIPTFLLGQDILTNQNTIPHSGLAYWHNEHRKIPSIHFVSDHSHFFGKLETCLLRILTRHLAASLRCSLKFRHLFSHIPFCVINLEFGLPERVDIAPDYRRRHLTKSGSE